jgi:hypothetical protein
MKSRKNPVSRRRYSIGEWYGDSFEMLTPKQRSERAKIEIETDTLTGNPCRFQKDIRCNKKGGVCSIRLYEQIDDGPVACSGPLITTCPLRFLEDDKIFRWVGKTILGTEEPIILKEIGFLDRLKPKSLMAGSDDNGDRDFIGRIDDVLVHPSRTPLDWCALELQAVYFSGTNMKREFSMLSATRRGPVPFPAGNRRPDWRSSGPKRLLPQLETKVPTIRTWGKKMAVVIDQAFFESLVGLEQEKYLSNSEIAWFVVGYDQSGPNGWVLAEREVVFTKLDSSVKALTGGIPLSRERFEEQLRLKLRTSYPKHPLAAKLP